ncbi:MAG: lipopolysaccharide biosynthesis protein [Nitrospirales bacterium]|nr:MAG: lipopolysaccharide biosynthesis protein [Nitrospirales bacterium]
MATGASIAAQLLQIFVMGRLLDTEDFGLMGMVLTVVALGFALGDAGISNAIIHSQNATKRELSSLYWLNVFAGVGVVGIVWLTIPLVVELYGEPRLTSLIRMASVVFVITPMTQQFQVMHEKELLFRRLSIIEMTSSLTGLTVCVTCGLNGLGVRSLIFGLISNAIMRALLLFAASWKRWRPALAFHWSECRRFFRFGVFQMGDRFLNQLGSQVDRIILGAMLGAGPLGFYYVAHNLSLKPFLIINPIVTRVGFPVFSRVQGRNDQLRSGFLQILELISAVLIPIYTVLIVLAGPALHVAMGPQWGPSAPLLQILGFVGIVLGLGNPMGSLFLAKGRPDISLILNVIRIILDVAAITIAFRYGVLGIAIAVLIVRAGVMFPIGFILRWKLVGMKPQEYLGTIAPFMVAAAITGASMYFARHNITWPSQLVELLICSSGGMVLYFGMLLIWQRNRMERIWMAVRA